VEATAESSGVVVECNNADGRDLENCFFMFGRRFIPIGRLARGEQKIVRIEPGAVPPIEYEDFDQAQDSASRLRRSMVNTLFVNPASLADHELLVRTYRGNEQGTRSKSLFAGWLDRAIDANWPGEDSMQYRGFGLVALEPQWRVPNGSFLIPKGGMSLRLLDPGWWLYYYGKSMFRGNHPFATPLPIEFAVPSWALPAELEDASLFIQFNGEAYKLRVQLDGQWLDLPAEPTGRWNIPITRNEMTRGGRIQFRVMVEPSDAYSADRAWEGYRWTLSEFDIECRFKSAEDRSIEGTGN
jgi:hypothetical protein